MAHVDIKCAECGAKLKVAEKLLGTTIKCPKCKSEFVAEIGESYDLAEEAPQPRVVARDSDEPDQPKRGRPTASKPAKGSKPETKAERELRERMEKWAQKMDE
jgi:phage FluMu protein Com